MIPSRQRLREKRNHFVCRYSHKASGKSSIELRAETEQARGRWVAAINAEVQKMKVGPSKVSSVLRP